MESSTDIMTATEMATVLRRDERSLTEAISALEEAETTYTGRTRRVAHSSDEGHAVGLRDHLPALTAAEAAAARVASAAERNARQVLAQTATTTRMTVAAEVEAVAATRVPLVSRLVGSAPLTEIRDRLKAAIVAGDVADQYLLASLVPARLAGEAPVGQATARPQHDAARAEIGRLLGRVRDELRDTSLDPVRAQAGAILETAAVARPAATARQKQDALAARIDSGETVAWPRPS